MLPLLSCLTALAAPPVDAQHTEATAPGLEHLPAQSRYDLGEIQILVRAQGFQETSTPLHAAPSTTSEVKTTLELRAGARVHWTDSQVHVSRPERFHAKVAQVWTGKRWDPVARATTDKIEVAFEPGDTLLRYAMTEDHSCWIGFAEGEQFGFALGPCADLNQRDWEQAPYRGEDRLADRQWWVFVPPHHGPPEGGWLHIDQHVWSVDLDIPHQLH